MPGLRFSVSYSIHSILVTKFYERMVKIIPTKLMLDEHSANFSVSVPLVTSAMMKQTETENIFNHLF